MKAFDTSEGFAMCTWFAPNADDLPLPEEEVEAARKAAFDYYTKSRALIPSTAKR